MSAIGSTDLNMKYSSKFVEHIDSSPSIFNIVNLFARLLVVSSKSSPIFSNRMKHPQSRLPCVDSLNYINGGQASRLLTLSSVHLYLVFKPLIVSVASPTGYSIQST